MGLTFPNALGLAAGVDKNGDALPALAELGFGFIEVGTTTPRPEYGNHGAENLTANLAAKLPDIRRRLGEHAPIIGVSIGMNAATAPTAAARDYLFGLQCVWDHVDYITVNLHAPSAAQLMQPHNRHRLDALLDELKAAQQARAQATGRYVPLVAKIALEGGAEHRQAAATAQRSGFDGLLVSLTDPAAGTAEAISDLTPVPGDALPIIAVGGVHCAADVRQRLTAGATLVQLYSAFVGAPFIARRIQRALARAR